MVDILNALGKKGDPFFFLISFDKKEFYAAPLDGLDEDIYYTIDGQEEGKTTSLKKFPLSFSEYKEKFDSLQQEIKQGNTYLSNLCCITPVETKSTLKEIYNNAKGRFKLLFKDRFVCFSPESFVEIQGNQIMTFPMKGTIDSSIENAEEKILNDEKELAEHVMVVDLLRNDLSIVAKKVRVEKFRYVEKVGELLQVSSKITGDLEKGWQKKIGEIFNKILPAGSISGTPKRKSVEILKGIEGFDRGWFSGVFGVFDGKDLKSAVIIRYIEKEGEKLFFKSGCGITEASSAEKEHQEMKDKVYVPFY